MRGRGRVPLVRLRLRRVPPPRQGVGRQPRLVPPPVTRAPRPVKQIPPPQTPHEAEPAPQARPLANAPPPPRRPVAATVGVARRVRRSPVPVPQVAAAQPAEPGTPLTPLRGPRTTATLQRGPRPPTGVAQANARLTKPPRAQPQGPLLPPRRLLGLVAPDNAQVRVVVAQVRAPGLAQPPRPLQGVRRVPTRGPQTRTTGAHNRAVPLRSPEAGAKQAEPGTIARKRRRAAFCAASVTAGLPAPLSATGGRASVAATGTAPLAATHGRPKVAP